ncbi:unnamed protein product, partial [Cyprideis torosa]
MAIRNPSQVTVFHVVCKSLFCSVLVLVLVTISGASWTNFSCDGLRDLYVRKGFSVWDVPREPVREFNLGSTPSSITLRVVGRMKNSKLRPLVKAMVGPSLVICQGPSEESCCTRTIEHKLSAKSRLDFDSKLSHRISEVANGLRRRERVLDGAPPGLQRSMERLNPDQPLNSGLVESLAQSCLRNHGVVKPKSRATERNDFAVCCSSDKWCGMGHLLGTQSSGIPQELGVPQKRSYGISGVVCRHGGGVEREEVSGDALVAAGRLVPGHLRPGMPVSLGMACSVGGGSQKPAIFPHPV